MLGEKDRAACPKCGRSFVRVREGRKIRIIESDGQVERALVQTLVGDIERMGGSLATAREADGRIGHRADVLMRRSAHEEPVHHQGRLLGYFERMGDPVPGVVSIDESHIRFHPGGGGATLDWPLLTLRAIQTSSSALQISPDETAIIQFKFLSDSPFRWEDLLRSLLRRAYEREGRGEIIEFQPRIIAA